MEEIINLETEQVQHYHGWIEQQSIEAIAAAINQEDQKIAKAIEPLLPKISEAAKAMALRFKQGGRIIYCGAGSSGRLGLMDGAELIPTYGIDQSRVIGLIAGGPRAYLHAVEAVEDSKGLAIEEMERLQLTAQDIVIGIAASGRTPYTLSALRAGKLSGALTIGVSANPQGALEKIVDFAIEASVGAEVIAGSTRMKAGTAQKLILNMLSTMTMIQLGRVYHNRMIYVQATNEKLKGRAEIMLADLCGCSLDEARETLITSHYHVATGLVMIKNQCSYHEAIKQLELADGNIYTALKRQDHA